MPRNVELTRRSTLKLAGSGVIAAVVARTGGRFAGAQEATPAAGTGGAAFAALGLPELTITITDTGFEGVEETLSPGTYLVHATSRTTESSNLTFMQLPEGMTADDLMTMLGGGDSGETGGETGSPVAEGEEDLGAPPDWFYTVHLPGGVGIDGGQSAHFVVTFQPGTYIAWGEDPSAPQAPVEFTVSGDPATAMAEPGTTPEADVTILELATDNGFAFELDGDFAASSQVVEVTNNSDQPHFVEIDRLPEGTTRDDVDALFSSFMSGTPIAGGLSETDLQPAYFIGTQSAGTTQWHELTLDPGTYGIVCWIPDPTRGGVPHAMEGMYDVFTVSG
jgi:hypothetical protein